MARPLNHQRGVRIGVISDTHNLFDERIPRLFSGVHHILHSGDIGSPAILRRLEQIAPVTAVSGNTDDSAYHYPETQVVELAGRKFLLHHIVQPAFPSDSFKELLAKTRPHVVVFGHTHKPFSESINGIHFLNPGYAGKPRFSLPRSLAILDCAQYSLKPEYFAL